MDHYWSLDAVQLSHAWLTIGSFDGVHLGHQKIVRQMVEQAHAASSPAAVLTFHPHPASVLGKRNGPLYLTTPEYRAKLLGDLGVDVVITHPFSKELAGYTAEEFMRWVKAQLGLDELWVGYDFALGRDREGKVPRLRELGESLGYRVREVGSLDVDGEPVSSRRIRAALEAGDIEQANRLLGRPYFLCGDVIHGDNRGRSIGIPTANLEIWKDQIIPRAGVYVCHATLDGETWGAVTNVGVRPTFEQGVVAPRVEAHILDFDQEIYGRQLCLDFLARLRDEQKFSGIDTLLQQIHQDIARGREILNPPTPLTKGGKVDSPFFKGGWGGFRGRENESPLDPPS